MLIRFKTFLPGCNSGLVVELGEHEVLGIQQTYTGPLYAGLTSREIKTQTVLTVSLDGRTFVVDADGSVTLPSDFNPFPKPYRIRCPSCDAVTGLRYTEFEQVERDLIDNNSLRVGSPDLVGGVKDRKWFCSHCRREWPVTDAEADEILWP